MTCFKTSSLHMLQVVPPKTLPEVLQYVPPYLIFAALLSNCV